MRVWIGGAGIAGPTLAYWLIQAGHTPSRASRPSGFHCATTVTMVVLRLPKPGRDRGPRMTPLHFNGHRFLPVDGHENCPVAVMRSARWRPWDLPRGLVAVTRSSGGG